MSTRDFDALGFDPAPGEPEKITALADRYRRVAESLGEAHEALPRIGNSDGLWQGKRRKPSAEPSTTCPICWIEASGRCGRRARPCTAGKPTSKSCSGRPPSWRAGPRPPRNELSAPNETRTSAWPARSSPTSSPCATPRPGWTRRSEEHTSELQSRENLVCRLLLEKKK